VKENVVPLASVILFIMSIWALFAENGFLALYLLGAAVYLLLVLAVVYLYSIDTIVDLIEKSRGRR
jgi:hypothetical protein